jgi:hypothetical protein
VAACHYNPTALGVLGLEGTIANAADNGSVIECLECCCLITLGQEHLLASVAPRLKVVRIRAVLDKPDGFAAFDHVAADHRSHTPAVGSAVNIQRSVVEHGKKQAELLIGTRLRVLTA